MEKNSLLRSLLNDAIRNSKSQIVSLSHEYISMPPTGFELSARDYLTFAEQELGKSTQVSLINCVSHLKRATDCQLDTFLHFLNLHRIFKGRNLKFEKKMEFLHAIGLFSPRSLNRLNTIRNKTEHEYKVPEIKDLDVYFDLVSAFVDIVERASIQPESITLLAMKQPDEAINLSYDRQGPSISLTRQVFREEVGTGDIEDECVVYADKDIHSFAYFFRALVALCQYAGTQDKHALLLAINESDAQE